MTVLAANEKHFVEAFLLNAVDHKQDLINKLLTNRLGQNYLSSTTIIAEVEEFNKERASLDEGLKKFFGPNYQSLPKEMWHLNLKAVCHNSHFTKLLVNNPNAARIWLVSLVQKQVEINFDPILKNLHEGKFEYIARVKKTYEQAETQNFAVILRNEEEKLTAGMKKFFPEGMLAWHKNERVSIILKACEQHEFLNLLIDNPRATHKWLHHFFNEPGLKLPTELANNAILQAIYRGDYAYLPNLRPKIGNVGTSQVGNNRSSFFVPAELTSVTFEQAGIQHKQDEFICPLTLAVIQDPVKLSSKDSKGKIVWHYFERGALMCHIENCKKNGQPPTNPINRELIKPGEPLEAPEFKQKIIDELKKAHQNWPLP